MKKRRRIACLLLSCFLLFSMTFVSPLNTFAQTIETEIIPTKAADVALTDWFEDLLTNSNEQTREKILEQAAYAGLSPSDFSISLSGNDISILKRQSKPTPLDRSDKRILRAPFSNAETLNVTSYSTSDMPDYALWPEIYMQETSSWCRAGVIQTILMYINGTSPSQSSIIANCVASLPAMRNYVNERLPEDYVLYAYAKYGGDQETFNRWLAFDVTNYQPMMFAMKNATGSTAIWPYPTDGHYSICCGLLTWANDEYFIGDPYYFSKYVKSATANDGYHNKNWYQLNAAITSSHGENNQHVVW